MSTIKGAPAQAAVRLDELPAHRWATVIDVTPSADQEAGDLALRLTEIGFVPGEPLRIVAVGRPGREPLAVRLGHSTFALRRHEAALVRVQPAAGAAHD